MVKCSNFIIKNQTKVNEWHIEWWAYKTMKRASTAFNAHALPLIQLLVLEFRLGFESLVAKHGCQIKRHNRTKCVRAYKRKNQVQLKRQLHSLMACESVCAHCIYSILRLNFTVNAMNFFSLIVSTTV